MTDVPPPPSYYALPGLFVRTKIGKGDDPDKFRPADLMDVVQTAGLNYERGSTFCHVFRAGRKPGESEAEALENALVTLLRDLDAARRREKGEGTS